MLPCYDQIEDGFQKPLQKIKCAFADRVYEDYKAVRYGIASCNLQYSLEELDSLRQLMEYIDTMDLSRLDKNTWRNRLFTDELLQAQVNHGCLAAFAIETLKVCNLSTLVEKINSL